MVVTIESRLPENGCPEKASENVNHNECGGEEACCGVSGELGVKAWKGFLIFKKQNKAIDRHRDENVVERKREVSLRHAIGFTQSGGDSSKAHDLVKRADFSSRLRGAKPEGSCDEEKENLKSFYRTFLSWKRGVFWKPCRKEDQNRTRGDEEGDDDSPFPDVFGFDAHGGMIAKVD